MYSKILMISLPLKIEEKAYSIIKSLPEVCSRDITNGKHHEKLVKENLVADVHGIGMLVYSPQCKYTHTSKEWLSFS